MMDCDCDCFNYKPYKYKLIEMICKDTLAGKFVNATYRLSLEKMLTSESEYVIYSKSIPNNSDFYLSYIETDYLSGFTTDTFAEFDVVDNNTLLFHVSLSSNDIVLAWNNMNIIPKFTLSHSLVKICNIKGKVDFIFATTYPRYFFNKFKFDNQWYSIQGCLSSNKIPYNN